MKKNPIYRRIFLSVALLLATASTLNGAEYQAGANLARYWEVVPGERYARIAHQPDMVRRVGYFARANGCDPALVAEFSQHIAQTNDPKTIAAICAAESGFKPKAVGKTDRNDRGAFQINRRYHPGPPADTQPIGVQVERAERILRDLLSQHGSLFEAVKHYNGSTRKSSQYAKRVLQLRRQIC
jgi:hypothetical protein